MPNSALYVPFWRTLADRCDITNASGDRCGMRLLVEGMACLRFRNPGPGSSHGGMRPDFVRPSVWREWVTTGNTEISRV